MSIDKDSMKKAVVNDGDSNKTDVDDVDLQMQILDGMTDNQTAKIKAMTDAALKIPEEVFQTICDDILSRNNNSNHMKDLFSKVQVSVSKARKAQELMRMLGIPTDGANIAVTDLYDVLMDEKKFKEVTSSLKNKAFW